MAVLLVDTLLNRNLNRNPNRNPNPLTAGLIFGPFLMDTISGRAADQARQHRDNTYRYLFPLL
ncbi:MAG: hypothetical protein WC328_12620, partial [Kiritimatiellia bacterium]